MTTKELHELDAWIAEHVMGWKQVKFINCVEGTFAISEVYGVAKHKRRNELEPFNPTTDPASAMMVIEKCGLRLSGTTIKIRLLCGNLSWIVSSTVCDACGNAESLPLAITKFARKLYDKT